MNLSEKIWIIIWLIVFLSGWGFYFYDNHPRKHTYQFGDKLVIIMPENSTLEVKNCYFTNK